MSDLPSPLSSASQNPPVPQGNESGNQAAQEPLSQGTPPTFFFSYAGIDREVAAHLVHGLQKAGVRVWWDQQQIEWGANWLEKLQEALAECQAFLLLVGASGIRKWVKQEFEYALRRSVEGQLRMFPLLLPGVTPEALPPFLSTTQAKTLPADVSQIDFVALAAELSQSTRVELVLSHLPLSPETCPFPGLEAFGEAEAPFFVGRQKETLKVVGALGRGADGKYRRWLHIHGTSGVGKSSLVRAGLIPTIKHGWVGASEMTTWKHWRIVDPMRPGSDPVLNLAEVLSKSLSREGRQLPLDQCHHALKQDEQALQVLLREWGSGEEAIVLVVDQLEELFTLTIDKTRRAHFDALLAAALTDQDGPLHLITTIRIDFMMQFNLVPRLQATLDEHAFPYFLTPMDEWGLKDVVQTPARLAGLTWSDPQLPEDMVKEVKGEPGCLPLLENVLRLLWMEARQRQSTTLSRQAYNDLGKLGGALANSADTLLTSLGKDGKQRALQVLTALVNVGSASRDTQDSRRTLTKATAMAVAGNDPQAEMIVHQLSGLRGRDTQRGDRALPRLIVLSWRENADGTSTDLVDLAHETLIRYNRDHQPYWPTFRKAIDDQREQIEHRQLAEALAKPWHDKGRSWWRGLATRSQLKGFRGLRDLEGDAADYVAASRRVVNGLNWAMGLVAGLLMGYLALWGWGQVAFYGLAPRLTAKLLLTQLGVDLLSPEMVPIKGGMFRMGDTQGNGQSDELHEVTIHTDFQLGKYEVTFEDYELFAKAIGYKDVIVKDEGWGRGRLPAINVSWEDAKQYISWLSELTGIRYRLPTEAEWEYAARAGTNTTYWWGNEIGTNKGNCQGCGSQWDNHQAAPVGSFLPNQFGLYDTAGNVLEWVEDCWHETYEGAPTDASAWLETNGGDCRLRVVRGGSWFFYPEDLRSSYRFRYLTDDRDNFIGFRLAQDIP